MTSPEWLTRRGGALEKSHASNAWFVLLNNQVQYRLVPVPVHGKFGVAITQTINGKRLPSDSQADTEASAITAGLKDLGKALGWEA
jgi:hypothetical protein